MEFFILLPLLQAVTFQYNLEELSLGWPGGHDVLVVLCCSFSCMGDLKPTVYSKRIYIISLFVYFFSILRGTLWLFRVRKKLFLSALCGDIKALQHSSRRSRQIKESLPIECGKRINWAISCYELGFISVGLAETTFTLSIWHMRTTEKTYRQSQQFKP